MNTKRIFMVAALGASVFLAGCGGTLDRYKEARNPTVSDLVLDQNTHPEINTISVPMPAPRVNVAPTRAEASSLWGRHTSSFFGDRRAKQIGDLLTVVIEIDDEAQLRNASDRSRTGSQQLGRPEFLGYGPQIHKVLPGVDPSDLPQGDSIVDLGSTSSASGEGSIRRNESISLRVAALIIQQLPNGNLVVAGRQEVKVNQELRELRVAGIVRPVDIRHDNTIAYDKIAEARIAYGGRGQISSVQSPRYGDDFLEVILPY